MNKLHHFFDEHDQFARHCGIELLEVAPGYAKAQLRVQPFHLNGAGTIHGGAIFTLADFVFAAASNSREQLALAINASTTFIKAIGEGTLFATARELSLNQRLGNYQVEICDQQDQLIAMFQGTAYRKSVKLLNEE